MKIIRRILPIVLTVWPYVIVLYIFRDSLGVRNLPDAVEQNFGLIYAALTFVVYGLNIWNAVTWPKEGTGKSLAFYNMIMKLIHIPFYILVFLLGVALFGSMVVPALLFISPALIMFLVFVDFLLMMTTSMYGISAAWQMAQKNVLPKIEATIFTVVHMIFVADVFGAIALFLRRRGVQS